jgi:N-dimethylarginine dimethylaminohydrolase
MIVFVAMMNVNTLSFTQILRLEGHLLDSLTLAKVLDFAQSNGAECQIRHFTAGDHAEALSTAHLSITCHNQTSLQTVVEGLRPYGAIPLDNTSSSSNETAHPNSMPTPATNHAHHEALNLEGNLLDDLVLAKTLDRIQQMGGSFTIQHFEAGANKQATSIASLRVSAPTANQLTIILNQIGAISPTKPVTLSCNGTPATVEAVVMSTATTSRPSARVATTVQPSLLMCPPTHFTVAYAINPWMTQDGLPDLVLAKHQWDALHKVLSQELGANIEILEPVNGLPDLVFTANAAFIANNKAIIAHYKHPERQGEEPYAQAWFKAHNFSPVTLPRGVFFEGAGDALIWEHDGQKRVFSGYRTRTDILSHNLITSETGLPVLSMELNDPRFYHIDVCMCPLTGGYLLYAPDAFDDYGRTVIEANVPFEKRIPITTEEATLFAGNAVNIGDAVVLNQPAADAIRERLLDKGFKAIGVDLSEFIKAGGSAKCLTLRLR